MQQFAQRANAPAFKFCRAGKVNIAKVKTIAIIGFATSKTVTLLGLQGHHLLVGGIPAPQSLAFLRLGQQFVVIQELFVIQPCRCACKVASAGNLLPHTLFIGIAVVIALLVLLGGIELSEYPTAVVGRCLALFNVLGMLTQQAHQVALGNASVTAGVDIEPHKCIPDKILEAGERRAFARRKDTLLGEVRKILLNERMVIHMRISALCICYPRTHIAR